MMLRLHITVPRLACFTKLDDILDRHRQSSFLIGQIHIQVERFNNSQNHLLTCCRLHKGVWVLGSQTSHRSDLLSDGISVIHLVINRPKWTNSAWPFGHSADLLQDDSSALLSRWFLWKWGILTGGLPGARRAPSEAYALITTTSCEEHDRRLIVNPFSSFHSLKVFHSLSISKHPSLLHWWISRFSKNS